MRRDSGSAGYAQAAQLDTRTGGNTMSNMTFPITPGAGTGDDDSVLPDLDPDGVANSEETPDGAARGGETGSGDSNSAAGEDLPYSWSDLDATEAEADKA
jgi:hypothetical protein